MFHGAVLRLDIDLEIGYELPTFYTRTVIPVWSWYIRDRYRDNGIDFEFLLDWPGLRRIRHVEVREPAPQLMIKGELSANFHAWEIAVRFLTRLPDVESLTICTEWHVPVMMQQLEKALRSTTNAKLLVMGKGDSCGHQP